MAGDRRGAARRHTAELLLLLRYTFAVVPGRAGALLALVLLAAAMTTASMIASVRLIAAAGETGALLVAAVSLGVVVVVGEALTVAASSVAADVGANVEAALRHQMIRAVGPTREDGDRPGQAELSAFVNGGYSPETVFISLASISVRLLSAVAAMGLLALFAWWAPLLILVTHLWSRRQNRKMFMIAVSSTIDERSSLARVGYLVDLALTPGTAKEWRLFGLQSFVLAELRREWRVLLGAVRPRRRRMLRSALSSTLLVAAAVATVLVSLAVAAGQGQVTVERFVLLVQALLMARGFTGFGGADYAVINGVPALVTAAAAAADRPAAPAPSTPAGGTGPAVRPPGVTIDDVTFSYPGREQPVLDGLSLRIPAGEVTAIVGANGAGKTTLLRLLQAFETPRSGRIRVDGVDLALLDPAEWRTRLAVVRQDFVRYPLSVADNVAVAGTADPRELDRALRAAGAATLVEGLPRGTDTLLAPGQEGGAELSGGQWQRIALARALYAARDGARLVLLDEPTASLDPRSEMEIFQNLLAALRGCTVVLVSHRFAAVRLARHIVVVADGRVVEEGDHHELLAADGWYASAYRLQAQRYEAGDGSVSADEITMAGGR
ncbi:ATP-binding cassette domain-containing protein [Micromonospora sp. NPDC049051]|uniref:ATP-binding cassette domain-containing protein n=1 Tax=unclassified Micromonospora TaxID=2617518 RepID=UPI0037139529